MLKKLDYKTIFIIVLAVVVVLLIVFRPSKSIDKYEDEIGQLHQQNEKIFDSNDSLRGANKILVEENKKLLLNIDSNEVLLDSADTRIIGLEDEKGKVSDNVRMLDANGVASAISNYVTKRTK